MAAERPIPPVAAWPTAAPARRPLLPLVRQLSGRVTPFLARLPVTPNHVTLLSTAAGLAAAWCLLHPGFGWAVAGSAAFIACQVLDNCDGELARLKGLGSRFGALLDDFGDWIVHAALFLALGTAASTVWGHGFWFWCGVVAAAGITLEYVIDLLRGPDEAPAGARPEDAAAIVSPGALGRDPTWADRAVYVFRVLLDVDFCFILPLFVLTGATWILLPAAAIGNHVYWMAAFHRDARALRA